MLTTKFLKTVRVKKLYKNFIAKSRTNKNFTCLQLRSFDKGFRQNKAESFTGNFESAIMNKLGEGFIKLEYTSNVPRKNAVKPFYITIKKGIK